jgi:CHAD domain-containing protein
LEHFHPAPEEYKHEQQQLQSAATTTFVEKIRQYRRDGRKAGRRLLTDIRKIPVQNIRDWNATQLIKISVLLTAAGDQLHKARKLIKELLYIQSLLPQKITDELKLNKDYLDQLQDAIGQWHDAAIVADAWAGKDLGGSQAMIKECREKLATVRSLAGEFYLRAHLD